MSSTEYDASMPIGVYVHRPRVRLVRVLTNTDVIDVGLGTDGSTNSVSLVLGPGEAEGFVADLIAKLDTALPGFYGRLADTVEDLLERSKSEQP